MIFAKICCNYLAFSAFLHKNAENDYFDQRLECAAPKRWSKYTTIALQNLWMAPKGTMEVDILKYFLRGASFATILTLLSFLYFSWWPTCLCCNAKPITKKQGLNFAQNSCHCSGNLATCGCSHCFHCPGFVMKIF